MPPPLAFFDRDVSVSSSARGDERVLVEHFVEVAHPEQQDCVAMLLLRVEVLPHCGRGGRRGRRGGIRRKAHAEYALV
jgi:hypothetical protein